MGAIQQVLYKDYLDDFNRANGSPGSNYVTAFFAGQSGVTPVISSNQLRAGTTTTNNTNTQVTTLRNDAETLTDNQIISARVVSAANGLFAGVVGRASLDGQWAAVAVWNNAAVGIQTRRNGVGDAVRANVSGNFLTANDTVLFDIDENVFRVIRNRAGTLSTLATWTDTGNAYPGDPSRRFGGVLMNSDRNVFGTQGWGTNLDDLRIRDIGIPGF